MMLVVIDVFGDEETVVLRGGEEQLEHVLSEEERLKKMKERQLETELQIVEVTT